MPRPTCKVCGANAYSEYCFRHKPRKPIEQRKPLPRPTKPIKQKGKRTLEYEKWRDTVARPYLDKKYGIRCQWCDILPPEKPTGGYYRHDVDHIKPRGSHYDLRMSLSNVRYLCRRCHDSRADV